MLANNDLQIHTTEQTLIFAAYNGNAAGPLVPSDLNTEVETSSYYTFTAYTCPNLCEPLRTSALEKSSYNICGVQTNGKPSVNTGIRLQRD